MAVNKVDTSDGRTLIDLTSDTATAADVLEGRTLHLASGAPAVGTYHPSDEIEARLRATVGHSSKNLLEIETKEETQTINGVTFTVDKQAGTITANGTATQDARFSSIRFYLPTGNYYFLGCPNGGSESTWDVYMLDYVTGGRCKMWNGITDSSSDYDGTKKECRIVAEHLYGITLRIRRGQTVNNLVFKPMVWDGSISDDTFEPFVTPTDERIASLEAQAATSDEIEARMRATVGHSSKNLLPITLSSGTYTAGGANLTYTVDKAAGTITLNGTSRTSGVIVLTVYEDSTGKISGDLYISGGGNENARLTGRDLTLNAGMMAWDGVTPSAASTGENDSQQIRPIAGHDNDFRYRILAGAKFNNVVLKPMLRSGSISDDTFEPYVTPTDEKKQDKPVVLWEGDATTNLTVSVGDNSYYSYYILTGVSDVKIDPYAETLSSAIFTVIIHSDMSGSYCAPFYDVYAILTISYQSSQGVTNMVIDNPKNITLNKIIGIPK